MFVPCPHCQFLVAHHPQLRPLPAGCPRCGRPLQEEVVATAVGDEGTGDAGVAIDADAGQEVDRDASSAALANDADTGQPMDDGSQDGGLAAAGSVAAASVAADTAAIDTAPASMAQAAPHAPADSAPAAFTSAVPRNHWARWSWPLIALLALLLALQILLADRVRLAADPRWRPLVESLCGALRCDLPAWHEPGAFTMLDRKVRPAPQPGALRVDATFRNDARWPQAWPALQLALSDADGRVLGSRVFQPAEYLGTVPATRLSPGQSAQVTFLVQEPAPGTVAFSFEFR